MSKGELPGVLRIQYRKELSCVSITMSITLNVDAVLRQKVSCASKRFTAKKVLEGVVGVCDSREPQSIDAGGGIPQT